MPVYKYKEQIECPHSIVFHVISSFMEYHEFIYFIDRVSITSERVFSEDVEHDVVVFLDMASVFDNKISIPSSFPTSLNFPCTVRTCSLEKKVEILSKNVMFKKFSCLWTVISCHDSSSIVYFSFDLDLKNILLNTLIAKNKNIIARNMVNIFKKRSFELQNKCDSLLLK